MNRFEIRDILKAYKEHFRVLPTLVQNELNGIIDAIDNDTEFDEVRAKYGAGHEKRTKYGSGDSKPVKKETPAKSFTTGKVAKKKAKKKGK